MIAKIYYFFTIIFKLDGVLIDDIQYRMNIIENDIDIRIESIIVELNKLRDELKNELKEICEKFKK